MSVFNDGIWFKCGLRQTTDIVAALQRRCHRLWILMPMLVLLLCVGCGPSDDDDNGGGSSSADGDIQVSWSVDCTEQENLNVVFELYAPDNTYLGHSKTWSCSQGSETILNAAAGEDRSLLLLVEDENGQVLYRGLKTGVDVVKGSVVTVDTITAYPFVTDLKAPADATESNALPRLDWDYVRAAVRYTVSIAADEGFETLVLQESLAGPPFTPTGLAPNTTYYWKVSCVDIFATQGADSDIWSFTITSPEVTITFPSDGETFSEYYEIYFTGEAYDDVDGALTETSLVWTSSLDGDLGYGGFLELFGLSIGSHEITLTATNNQGFSGSDSITIEVTAEE